MKRDRPEIFEREAGPAVNDDLEMERKDILSMFAHDIKNAIVPSIWLLTRILSGKTQNLQADLEAIRDGLTTAERLLTSFVDLSRSETKE